MNKLDNELWVEASMHLDDALARLMDMKDKDAKFLSEVLHGMIVFMEEKPGIRWPNLKEVSNG